MAICQAFQYRKRYYPVATENSLNLDAAAASVLIPQAVLPSCNHYATWTKIPGDTGFNTASGITQLQPFRRIGKSSDIQWDIRFNTASGITQLQQCPWNPAPGQG